jgi:hypothetical protein
VLGVFPVPPECEAVAYVSTTTRTTIFTMHNLYAKVPEPPPPPPVEVIVVTPEPDIEEFEPSDFLVYLYVISDVTAAPPSPTVTVIAVPTVY